MLCWSGRGHTLRCHHSTAKGPLYFDHKFETDGMQDSTYDILHCDAAFACADGTNASVEQMSKDVVIALENLVGGLK